MAKALPKAKSERTVWKRATRAALMLSVAIVELHFEDQVSPASWSLKFGGKWGLLGAADVGNEEWLGAQVNEDKRV
jgi:hypothetical protein